MHFRQLFYPKTIAVIGASTTKNSVGNDLVKNLVQQGYKGTVFPVNPKGGKMYGLTIYKSLSEIKTAVDLAVVAVPAAIVPSVLSEIGAQKIKAVIVISAGFKEVGNQDLEAKVIHLARRHDLTLIGPNCLGLLNPEIKLNASFAPMLPDAGSIAFVSQSGAICTSILDYAQTRGLGFSKFISVGNKAVVDETELLQYLYQDPKTKVILMYVEHLQQVAALMKLVKRITRGKPHKPVIILKSGRSAAGAKASASHTGALSGNDLAYDAVFAQCGVIRAQTMSELFDFAECFAHTNILKNDRIAVVTNAGGPGVVTADALIAEGLTLATFQPQTVTHLQKILPPTASVQNPVDLLGDASAERYQLALQAVAADKGVDGMLIILTPQSMTQVEDTARVITKLKKQTAKPLIVSFMGDRAVAKGLAILHQQHVATTSFPEPAARVFQVLHDFGEWLSPPPSHFFTFKDVRSQTVRKIIEVAQGQGQTHITLGDCFTILKAYGFMVIGQHVVTTESQLAAVPKYAEYALKIISPDISHKTEVGGVVLGVKPQDLKQAYTDLLTHIAKKVPKAEIKGVQVMEMSVEPGLEMIVGATIDPQLGRIIAVGLGGIYTEVFKDVSLGITPLTRTDAERMVNCLHVDVVLDGFRGQPALDEGKVIEAIGRLAQLVTDFPEIKEIDINPLKALTQGEGAVVLDARIILG